MINKFKGVYPALLTPFDSNNKINTGALKDVMEYNLKKGVTGFYVAGSTAEAFLLSDDERMSLYETAAEINAGRGVLIAHIGAISTDKAVSFAKKAKECGYDAISAIAPFYYKFSFAQIKKHYYDIVDAVDMPMIVYNFPNFSGVNLSVEQVAEFFCDPRFIGIKHTSNDFFALQQFKANFPDKLVFNGFDEMFLSGLSMGADGGIGSTYSFMAEKFIAIKKLYEEHKTEEALSIQAEANRIIKVMCRVGVMEAEKEVLCQLGFDFGTARAPFSVLTDEQKQLLRENITNKL